MRFTTSFVLTLALAACDPKAVIPPGGTLTTPGGGCLDDDGDGICDADELCSGDDDTADVDEDGLCGDLDPDDDNDGCEDADDALPTQFALDDDADGVGNHCDPCPDDASNDSDLDTICDSDDVCPGGDDRADRDNDAAPDYCDACPDDTLDDSDADGTCDGVDACPGFDDGFDPDLDGVPQDCDACPTDNPNDSDGDGVCEGVDACPGGDDADDLDGDGTADYCDPCPVDWPDDTDGDGVCDAWDLCPGYVDGGLDADGDNWSVAQGDCDDCDPAIGPHAFDVPLSLGDEDCNGVVDDPRPICDVGLTLVDTDPFHAANAIDICGTVPTRPWGVAAASYVRANGAAVTPVLAVGLMPDFGNILNQYGFRMLGLSSGYAREVGHPLACNLDSCNVTGAGTPPPGFPQDVVNCTGGTTIFDDVGLELDLVAPSNAIGFRLKFYFMSFEFPEYVCSAYNDQFVILMDPPPVGAIQGNIAVDSFTNPVSVNIAYQPVCNPASSAQWAMYCPSGCPALPSPYCPSGDADLGGTGFNTWQPYSGGTGWLEVTAPITPGQSFNLRMAIWDTGDWALDSTVLIDDFEWVAEPVDVGVQPN